MVEFKAWPKINRSKGFNCTITEKIDGTNGCLIIQDGELVGVQSRNRLLTRETDNFGFCNWAMDNKDSLESLGDGYHYGEWAGPGIQKNPHNFETKTFLLFNTFRWGDTSLPEGVTVVPVLYEGSFSEEVVYLYMSRLEDSAKFYGYTPEGVCVYLHDPRTYLKYTFANSEGKWKS